jgi:hypothetical protein
MVSTFTIIIAIIIITAIIAAGAYVYSHREDIPLLTSRVQPAIESFDVGIEALGGFSAGQVTALSTSAIPGNPYDVSLFAGKTTLTPVIPEGIKKKKQWVRHGEIRPAYIGMNRF